MKSIDDGSLLSRRATQWTVPGESFSAFSTTVTVALCGFDVTAIPTIFGTDGMMSTVGWEDGVDVGKCILVGATEGEVVWPRILGA